MMCDMYHWLRLLQAGMLTFPRASSSLPAELSAVELCWLMILIAPHTAWLTVNERGSKRQKVRAEEREREIGRKKITHSISIHFFSPYKLCFHGNHTIGTVRDSIDTKKRWRGGKNKNTKVWLEDFKGTSSFNYGCLLQCCSFFIYAMNNEKKCEGVIRICDNTSMALNPGCQ